MTRARRLRRSFDLVLASHHYYGPKMGLRRLARHFSLPRSTVRDAIHRVDRDDPELREVAVRWGHLRMLPGQLGPIIMRDRVQVPQGLEDIAADVGRTT